MKFCAALLFFIFFGMSSIYAQKTLKKPITVGDDLESRELYYFLLKNKSKIIGEFSHINDNGELIIRTDFSSLTISKTEIDQVLSKSEYDEYIIMENPHSYKYLIGPSALGKVKGESHLQSTYLMVNSYSYAFSNHFSLSGSSTIVANLILLEDLAQTITREDIAHSIVPLFSGYKLDKNWHYGGGTILGHAYNYAHLVAPFGLITFGNVENNITLRGGFLYSNVNDYIEEDFFRPFGTLSAMWRVGKNVSIITESWSTSNVGTNDPIASVGVRFFGKHLSLDVALLYNEELAEYAFRPALGYPFMDLVYKF